MIARRIAQCVAIVVAADIMISAYIHAASGRAIVGYTPIDHPWIALACAACGVLAFFALGDDL